MSKSSSIQSAAGSIDSELVARATALRPLLAEHADRTEAERQVVPEVMDALEEAGLFEVLVPQRAGGLGATMATQLAIAAELAGGCASTAWVQTIISITTWGAARSPAGADLFAPDADGQRPRMCGVISPSATATPVDGGYRVTGAWPFASGSFRATWFSGGTLVTDASGDVVGVGMVLLPSADISIDDTWFVAGMSGTSSNTVVADDVFVPSHRFMDFSIDAPAGDDPADRWPLGSALALVVIGPLLGAARACADAVIDKAPKRAIAYTTYTSVTDSQVAVTEIARALLDIDSAWLHAFQAAAYIDAVGAGADRDPLEEARLRGQCGYLTDRLRHGVDSLLTVAGAGSFASANTVQRHWRDLNVGSRHAFLSTNISLETYGRALFGLDKVLAIV